MHPVYFLQRSRQAGFYRKGLGIGAVNDLAALAESPVPLREPETWRERSIAPSDLPNLGKLVAAGFAKLNRESKQYHATPDGLKWLQRARDLIAQNNV